MSKLNINIPKHRSGGRSVDWQLGIAILTDGSHFSSRYTIDINYALITSMNVNAGCNVKVVPRNSIIVGNNKRRGSQMGITKKKWNVAWSSKQCIIKPKPLAYNGILFANLSIMGGGGCGVLSVGKLQASLNEVFSFSWNRVTVV